MTIRADLVDRGLADQRRGMGELIAHVRQNEAQIRRDRAAAGLPNR